LHARTLLAGRLLRRLPCGAWYWPLAVPEFAPEDQVAGNLRRMAWTLASWPEARVALPAWLSALVGSAGAVPLAACMSEREGEALLQRAGFTAAQRPARPKAQRDADAARPAHEEGPALPAPTIPVAADPPAWLQVLLAAAATGFPLARAAALRVDEPPTHRFPVADAAHATVPDGVRRPSVGVAPSAVIVPDVDGVAARSTGSLGPAKRAPLPPLRARSGGVAAPADTTVPEAGRGFALSATGEAWLQPTAFGGALFLLPVLQRLGLPAWLPPGDSGFAALVLQGALRRLQAPGDEPAWQLTARAAGDGAPHPGCAPPAWSDPALAPLRGRVPLAARLERSRSDAEQADAWLDAARYWLRRVGRIGLATLVQRPARFALTPTHADLHFDLAATDLRVRRLGLDCDPGWLPWFGRVVGFHYAPLPR